MKRSMLCLTVVVTGLSLAGCYTPSGQPDNTATGALAGGATGAMIGSMARNPGPGALVGAAVGAVAGGAIGHGADQAQEARLQAQRTQALQQLPQGHPLSIADVEAMTKAGLSDQLIISQIQNSRTIYHLNTAEIISLKNAGVSDKIIDYMINTPDTVAATSAPLAQPAPSQVIVQPYPEYYWVPGGWFWWGGWWGWHEGYWGHGPRYGGYGHGGYYHHGGGRR
jgi:uncharacterized protein YcfJ